MSNTNADAAEPAATWTALESLRPWPENPRKNKGRPVEDTVASLIRFGWGRPMVARKGELVVGHTARLAALELANRWRNATDDERKTWHPEAIRTAETGQVPTRHRDDLSESEAHLLAIADNRLGEHSEWDMDALPDIFDLEGWGVDDLMSAGWTPDEQVELGWSTLESIDDATGETSDQESDEDDVPEPPRDPVTRLGDVWTLGDHVLICGDSCHLNSFHLAMGNDRADLILTDPPYGVDYVGKTKDKLEVHNDGAEQLAEILRGGLGGALQHSKCGSPWYVCGPAGPHMAAFINLLIEFDVLRQVLVWVKDRFVLGHSDFHYRHEPIFYGWAPGASHRPPPGRTFDTVWEFPRPTSSQEHPTMKPVALFSQALRLSADHGAIILDPFMGSGTTLIASHKLGMRSRGIELSPAYCDVIVERWQKITGGQATRKHA